MVTDLYDLEYHEPEALWLLILAIHRGDKSVAVQQVLSAGPIENLLAIHGESFIERVEAEARKDPMQWVHCHIAKQPVPPVERPPNIPRPVSTTIIENSGRTELWRGTPFGIPTRRTGGAL